MFTYNLSYAWGVAASLTSKTRPIGAAKKKGACYFSRWRWSKSIRSISNWLWDWVRGWFGESSNRKRRQAQKRSNWDEHRRCAHIAPCSRAPSLRYLILNTVSLRDKCVLVCNVVRYGIGLMSLPHMGNDSLDWLTAEDTLAITEDRKSVV